MSRFKQGDRVKTKNLGLKGIIYNSSNGINKVIMNKHMVLYLDSDLLIDIEYIRDENLKEILK